MTSTTGQDRTSLVARVRAVADGTAPYAAAVLTSASRALLDRLVREHPAGPGAAVPTGWPVAFAHRGGAEIAPENTLEAFRAVEALGDTVLEFDVQASADGTAVLMHDLTVDRTTDGTGPVAGLTVEQLRRLDAGYRFTPDGGATFPWRGRGVHVPTLAEVYAAFPDRRVAIELKGNRPGAEEIVWRTVEAAGAQGRTLVATNRTASIRRFRQVCGGTVPTAASVPEFALFRLLTLLGGHAGHALPFQGVQPPDAVLGLRVLTPQLVRRAHEAGLRVDVWTIDDEDDMRRLREWGVDGIMTDRPDVLSAVLGEA